MKASNLIFQREAEEDIATIAIYIAGDSRDAAEKFFAALDNLCELLMNTPGIGSRRIFQSPRLTEMRIFPLKNMDEEAFAISNAPSFRGRSICQFRLQGC